MSAQFFGLYSVSRAEAQLLGNLVIFGEALTPDTERFPSGTKGRIKLTGKVEIPLQIDGCSPFAHATLFIGMTEEISTRWRGDVLAQAVISDTIELDILSIEKTAGGHHGHKGAHGLLVRTLLGDGVADCKLRNPSPFRETVGVTLKGFDIGFQMKIGWPHTKQHWCHGDRLNIDSSGLSTAPA